MVHVIQLDWIFLQHVSTNMVDAFAGVEKMIWKTFLPSLFFGKEKPVSPIRGALSTIPVKKYLLGVLNPVMSMNNK